MDEIFQFPQGGEGPESRALTPSSVVARGLPEEWGGRPTGTSRRAIRMQGEWDKQRAQQIEEMKTFQQMELQRKQFEIQARDQQLQEDDFFFRRNAAEAEQRLKAQQTSEAKEFLGAVNSLDPRSPDYRDNLIKLRRQYPLGSLDSTVIAVVGDYDKVHSVYMDSEKEGRQEEERIRKQNEEFRVQQEAAAAELGIDTNQFVNPETGQTDRIGLSRAIGEARAERGETREAKAEEKAQTKEVQSEIKLINRELRDLNDSLETEKNTFRRSKGKVQEEAAAKIQTIESQIKRRQEEIQALKTTETPKAQAIPEEAVEAARKFIRENPDSPEVPEMVKIIERYESSQQAQPAGEEGGGETISEPETTPQPTAAAPAGQQPFLTQEESESIPQTRREFATGEMAETLDTMEEMNTELDRLYKVRFVSKDNMEKYNALKKKLGEKRKEDTKLRTARRKEIREEMKKLGPYGSGENRKKYVALERELRLISGV